MPSYRQLIRLMKDRRGVIALMFGIIWGPMIGWTFMALTLALKAADQQLADSALDAALIAAAATPTSAFGTDASSSTIATDRQLIVNTTWVADGGPGYCGSTATVNVPAETASGTLTASINCHAKAGTSTNNYYASSTVQVQGANLEIAMVLDNTGSMAWNNSSTDTYSSATLPSKLTALKVAAFDFLNGLAPHATAAGQIKVAIVPMTTDIYIGKTTTTQAIVKYSYNATDSTTHDSQILNTTYALQNGSCSKQGLGSGPTNIVAGTTYYSNQGLSTTTGCGQHYSVLDAYSIPSTGVTNTSWSGCVVDRDEANNPTNSPADYDASNTLPDVNTPYTLYPADNINCGGTSLGPEQIAPLTDLYTCTTTPSSCITPSSTLGINALPQSLMNLLYCRTFTSNHPSNNYSDNYCATYVQSVETSSTSPDPAAAALLQYGGTYGTTNAGAMIPNGDTDLTIGLAWGWNMVTPGFPLSPNASTSSESASVDKIIIFFTDGYSTQDRFSENGTQMDNETKKICSAILSDQLDPYNSTNLISLYMVATADADTSLFETCQPDANYRYLNQTASSLDGTLTSILSKITALRVSQ